MLDNTPDTEEIRETANHFAEWLKYMQNGDFKPSDTCANCGQKRQRAGKPLNKLFAYGVDPDSIRDRSYIDYSHLFCSVGCYRMYHV